VSELTFTLRQPAQIGDRAREDNAVGTLEYIPGAVVRGAFAAAWLARNGVSRPGTPQREEFLRLFEGRVRFGALLPAGTEFTPLSVVGHKYEPTDDCPVIEYDVAVSDPPTGPCRKCGSPFEPQKGLHGAGKERLRKRRRTSVAIADSGVAANGQLFTRETLEAGQDFTGTLIGAGEDLAVLARLGPVRVGGRRTTHGKAEVSIQPSVSPPTAEQREDGMLIIRLRSPGIFTDQRGRPSLEPDPAELKHVLGTDAKVIDRWARWHQVSGWHIASGLPKPGELAAAAGSAYLIDPGGEVSAETLAVLGLRGFGLRRHEGFGDLGPPPKLREGKDARDKKARHQKELMLSVAALRRIPDKVTPGFLAEVSRKLLGHANGDPKARGFLDGLAGRIPDTDVVTAMRKFLRMPQEDAVHVAAELAREWK
jgi:CRISPR-associated protein Csx10